MFFAKLSVVPGASSLTVVVVMACLALAGCSSKPLDATAGWSPNKIYAEAKDEARSGSYDKAIPLFEKLEGRAAGTPLAQQAQLEKAYAQYKSGEQAQSEVHVARYYYSRGAYVAAINRAQTAITDYRDVPALEEATYIVYKSYDALGMTQLRDDTRRVLEKTYPKSEFMSKGFKAADNP